MEPSETPQSLCIPDESVDPENPLFPHPHEAHHRRADCCSEPAQADPDSRPLSARAARNLNLSPEEREAAEAEAAEWARVSNCC